VEALGEDSARTEAEEQASGNSFRRPSRLSSLLQRTTRVTWVEWVMLPCCPVNVMVYVPGGVPVLLLTQPQASALQGRAEFTRRASQRNDLTLLVIRYIGPAQAGQTS